jgi:hypothetical protein
MCEGMYLLQHPIDINARIYQHSHLLLTPFTTIEPNPTRQFACLTSSSYANLLRKGYPMENPPFPQEILDIIVSLVSPTFPIPL